MRSGGENRRSFYKAMTVQIHIDETIISRVDAVTSNRDQFIQRAVLKELRRNDTSITSEEIDRQIIEAYTRQPQVPDEYEIWQAEQVWED